jgi:hypothetical protein
MEAGALSEICEHKRVRRQCREFGGGITCKHKRDSAANPRVAHACGATFRRDWIGDIGFDKFHISEKCPLIFE